MNPELHLLLTKEGLGMSDDLNATHKRLRNLGYKIKSQIESLCDTFLSKRNGFTLYSGIIKAQ